MMFFLVGQLSHLNLVSHIHLWRMFYAKVLERISFCALSPPFSVKFLPNVSLMLNLQVTLFNKPKQNAGLNKLRIH